MAGPPQRLQALIQALAAHVGCPAARPVPNPTVPAPVTDGAKDELGVLGWPALGLPAPEYRHVPRLAPGSLEVNAHLAEHGFA